MDLEARLRAFAAFARCRSFSAAAAQLRISQPAVSKHLRALREAGLVEVRPDAQHRYYRIRPEPLAAVDDWLAQYRWLWSRSLDRLEAHLEDRRKT